MRKRVAEPEIPEGYVAATRPGSHVIEEGEEVSVAWTGITSFGPRRPLASTVWWFVGDIIPAEWAEEEAS